MIKFIVLAALLAMLTACGTNSKPDSKSVLPLQSLPQSYVENVTSVPISLYIEGKNERSAQASIKALPEKIPVYKSDKYGKTTSASDSEITSEKIPLYKSDNYGNTIVSFYSDDFNVNG